MKTIITSLNRTAIPAIALLLGGTVFAQPAMPEPGIDADQSRPAPPEQPAININVSYDASADVSTVRDASYEDRTSAAAEVEGNVAAAASAVSQLQSQLDNAPTDSASGGELQSALDAAMQARVEVSSQLSAYRRADVEQFESTRSALIDALEQFADAIGDLKSAR